MDYVPHQRTYPAPATKAPAGDPQPVFGDGFDDRVRLVRAQDHDPRIDNRHQALPSLQVRAQAPPPPAAVPPTVWRPLVSDGYSADLALAQMLMGDDEENLTPDALNSLSLEEVVPFYNQPGAKYAYAPTRGGRRQRTSPSSNSRGSPHPGPSTSSVRHSMPPPSLDDHKPFESHSLRSSNSYPMLIGHQPPLMHHQPFAEEPVKAEDVEPTPAPAPPSPTPSIPALPAPPAPIEPTESPLPSLPPTGPPPAAAPGPGPGPGPKRSGRATKRSPAPRRQECKTCGKKFQRPCQLTTHIRSHTGEQPHACPVCSRRFSVLSNCQRHVKLCRKRFDGSGAPRVDDNTAGAEPGPSASSFITFPDSISEDAARRSSEIPIRPKLVSHPSGSGGSSLGLERSESIGSAVEAAAGAGAASSATAGPGTYSPAGPRSGFTPSYEESGPRSFEPPQTIYEEPGSDYPTSDPTGYDASGSGSYDTAAPGPRSYDTATTAGSYDATNTGSGYESSSNPASFGQYPGGYGAQGYGQSSTASGAMEYGHYSHPSPSHIHVHPHPSPSHVHANSPAMYNSPLTMSAPPMHAGPSSMHDSSYGSRPSVVSPTAPGISPSVPSSSMLIPAGPGMTASHSTPSMSQVPVARSAAARRSTMSGFASGYSADAMPRRQTVVPSMSEPSSFVFQHSPAEVVNRAFDSEVKLESAEGGDVWSQQAPTQAQASAFQTQQARPSYDWSGSSGRYHPYGLTTGAPSSGPAPAESSAAYSYQQQHPQQQQRQQQSQMYGQPAGGFDAQHESFKVEQSNDGYSSGIAYNNSSSSYPISSQPDSGDMNMPQQQHYPDYSWSGMGSQWGRPGYNSQNQ